MLVGGMWEEESLGGGEDKRLLLFICHSLIVGTKNYYCIKIFLVL